MDYELIGKDVIHFPRLLDNCSELVNFFEATVSFSVPDWTPWMSGGDDHHDIDQYGQIKYIERKDILAEFFPLRERILSEIERHDKAVVDSFVKYLEIIGTSAENIETIKLNVLSHRPPNFTLKKYYVGKSLGPHPDWGEKTPAVFTIAVYLSDSYSGGKLNFPELDSSIELTEGSVVVFPSKFLHESTEITSGLKYLTNEIVFLDIELLDGRNVYA